MAPKTIMRGCGTWDSTKKTAVLAAAGSHGRPSRARLNCPVRPASSIARACGTAAFSRAEESRTEEPRTEEPRAAEPAASEPWWVSAVTARVAPVSAAGPSITRTSATGLPEAR